MLRPVPFAFLVITALTLCLWGGSHAQAQTPFSYTVWPDSPRAAAYNDRGTEAIRNESALPDFTVFETAMPRMRRDSPAPLMPPHPNGAHDASISPLEKSYSARAETSLQQFGYALLRHASPHRPIASSAVSGIIQDDYILGEGDRLNIIFRGQIEHDHIYTVDHRGLLVVGNLPPVSAAGRSLAAIRAELESHTARLHNTSIHISMDGIRQIGVLVVGHVMSPGRHRLNAFQGAIDALITAGGVDKTGSLRQIRLVRRGKSHMIDLYELLVHGAAANDVTLQDGDKIIVPPIGPTAAIAGNVNRPGIYELRPHPDGLVSPVKNQGRRLSLDDMLVLGGGITSPIQNRFMKLAPGQNGREELSEIHDARAPLFGNGALLQVIAGDTVRAGTVTLSGHTNRPGIHALGRVSTLSALLSDNDVFGSDIYPLIGIIARRDQNQMAPALKPFPPLLVRDGAFDMDLQDHDVVHLFSRAQIHALHTDDTNPAALNDITPAAGRQEQQAKPAPLDPVMQSFLRERSAFIRGAVRQESAWPVAAGATLENIIAVSGGLSIEANRHNIELTAGHSRNNAVRRSVNIDAEDPATIAIAPGDTVRVNQKFHKIAGNSILIIGEVEHPGYYDLMPGDKMSDLIVRAGGLRDHAYPKGAIFSRESERRAEEARFRAAARDLERALAVAMETPDKAPDATQLAMARDLAAELRQVEAAGRITVEADPVVLAAQPALDMLLESGDRIYIPKRPLTVRVNGEVLSPAALQFRQDKTARDYIAEAGGYSFHADQSRAFVLYPDGSARPLGRNRWHHNAIMIPPGATIIVPRDPKPFDFIESARDISQILSNLAITGIFINDLRDRN